MVVLTPTCIIGFRDPNGVRPLVAGRVGKGYMLASESCAFGPVDGHVERELDPGEIVVIDAEGMRFAKTETAARPSMCLFEFIYFARPDSVMYGKLLYVVPVPDSGIPAALGYSHASGIPYREGMMKSRYIHRTFIAPDQRLRELGVRLKLTPLVEHIRGKRLVLVDDSIVRATTTKQFVRLLFESGATEVHVRITAPPIKWPCFYGIDMCSKGELAAARMTIDEICAHVGATSLGYLSIDGAAEAVGEGKNRLCLACFNGDYPIPVPAEARKDAFDHPPEVGQMAAVSALLASVSALLATVSSLLLLAVTAV